MFKYFTCFTFTFYSWHPDASQANRQSHWLKWSGKWTAVYMASKSDRISLLQNVADGIAHLFITVQPSANGNTDKMLCVIKLCNNILS